jgi:hypothetical protein
MWESKVTSLWFAAAPIEAEPMSPKTTPQPASPAALQPDDLLKDLLKLGG